MNEHETSAWQSGESQDGAPDKQLLSGLSHREQSLFERFKGQARLVAGVLLLVTAGCSANERINNNAQPLRSRSPKPVPAVSPDQPTVQADEALPDEEKTTEGTTNSAAIPEALRPLPHQPHESSEERQRINAENNSRALARKAEALAGAFGQFPDDMRPLVLDPRDNFEETQKTIIENNRRALARQQYQQQHPDQFIASK